MKTTPRILALFLLALCLASSALAASASGTQDSSFFPVHLIGLPIEKIEGIVSCDDRRKEVEDDQIDLFCQSQVEGVQVVVEYGFVKGVCYSVSARGFVPEADRIPLLRRLFLRAVADIGKVAKEDKKAAEYFHRQEESNPDRPILYQVEWKSTPAAMGRADYIDGQQPGAPTFFQLVFENIALAQEL